MLRSNPGGLSLRSRWVALLVALLISSGTLQAQSLPALTLTWNTFMGAAGDDFTRSVVTDGTSIYVAGDSEASWGTPLQPFTPPQRNAFVARFDAVTGALIWNTFLGGVGEEFGNQISLSGGALFVAGTSTDTWGTPVSPFVGVVDGFLARLDAATGALTWNTFMGGGQTDNASGVSAAGGTVVVAGSSTGTWGTPVNPFVGTRDAFVATFDSATGALTWNSFLGSLAEDDSANIVLAGGSAVVTGFSRATWGTPVAAFAGGQDTFVASLNAATGALNWNTFLGGLAEDEGRDVTSDGAAVYVSGISRTSWGAPVSPFVGGTQDGFVAALNLGTGALTWNTFLGSTGFDEARGVALSGGSLFVGGDSTASWGSPINPFNGSQNAFAAQLDPASGTLSAMTFVGGSSTDGADIAVAADAVFLVGESSTTWGAPINSFTAGQEGYAAALRLRLLPPVEPPPAAAPVGQFDPLITKLGFVRAGGEIEWVISVSNAGSAAGVNVVISDTLPDGLVPIRVDTPVGTGSVNGQVVTVTVPALAPGQSFTFSIFSRATGSGSFINTACIRADNFNPTPARCATASAVRELPATGFEPQWRNALIIGLLALVAGWLVMRRLRAVS